MDNQNEKVSKEIIHFRHRLGNEIIVWNVVLAVLLLVSFIAKIFRPDEIEQLVQMLLPIHTLYVTSVVKFMTSTEEPKPLSEKQIKFSGKSFIRLHIFALLLLIVLEWVNALPFDYTIKIMAGVEAFFGFYVGIFLDSIFKAGGEKEN